MRRVALGLLATLFLAGPLLAQNPFGSTVARRSTEAPRNVAPAQYRVVKSTRVQEMIADHGYGEAAPCGCNHCGPATGRGRGGAHCHAGLLPCVFDNIPDLFICLLPKAHCCTYPRTCAEPSCWNPPVGCRCRQPLLNTLFSCNKRCGGGCTSCTSRGGTPGCGCETHTTESPGVEMLPPQPEPAMEEAFFKNESAALHRQRGAIGTGVRTTVAAKPAITKPGPALNRPMTSKSVMASQTQRKGPSMIIVGNATPLQAGE